VNNSLGQGRLDLRNIESRANARGIRILAFDPLAFSESRKELKLLGSACPYVRSRMSRIEKDPGSLGCARDDTKKTRKHVSFYFLKSIGWGQAVPAAL
jgi:hypothetical protein